MFTNGTIDAVAFRIDRGQTTAEIREMLIDMGLSEYDAYLCFKAAKFLLDSGTFYPRQGKDTR